MPCSVRLSSVAEVVECGEVIPRMSVGRISKQATAGLPIDPMSVIWKCLIADPTDTNRILSPLLLTVDLKNQCSLWS